MASEKTELLESDSIPGAEPLPGHGKRVDWRFAPKFHTPFVARVRVQIFGKNIGQEPVLLYDLRGFPTRWVRINGKWGLEFSFFIPEPFDVGSATRVFAVPLLMDLNGKIRDQTRVNL